MFKPLRIILILSITLTGAVWAAAPPPGPALDLVLSGGKIVDGTGAPWFRADLGIRRDRIVAIGDLSRAPARRRIDVGGRMVAPGFIDLLGQSEAAVLVDSRAESKIRQGITTELVGEGRSIAPLNDAIIQSWRAFIDRFHLKVDWRDLNGYARRLRKDPSSINLATLVGATNARTLVLGLEDVQPSEEELTQMEKLVERAMAQGAIGLSSALIYPPATYARTPELIHLAKAAARHGGRYATHLRSEADGLIAALDEAIAIGRAAQLPVDIWHLKVAGRDNWGRMKEVVARIERARAEGVDIAACMYPYDAAMNGLAANIPAWAQEGGRAAMLARLRDPEQRARIKGELWTSGGLGREDPQDILILYAMAPGAEPYLGKRLTEVAAQMGKPPEDALMDLLTLADGSVMVLRFAMSEADIALGLKQSWVSLCTDAGAQGADGPLSVFRGHPRGFGSTAKLLGHYAREQRLFSMEEAVRKMTSQPAGRMGLRDRGLLRPGMAADVVVFDPATVRDVSSYQDPMRYPEGIEWVLINGKVVLESGKRTPERPGRLLRHQ